MISFYKEFGPLGYLANYSDYGFTINGIYYKTVEHYYQSEKFSNQEIKEKIINASTPKEASNIGRDRNNIRIPNFDKIKVQVMYKGILEKFRQNRIIAYKLIETRNNMIAEATIDEYFWGIGKNQSGENNIGKILIKVREDIKKEILNNILSKAKKEDTIYVLGHKRPDADSIFSSYLLTNILNNLGINAKMSILENEYDLIDSDKELILDNLKIKPEIIKNPNQEKFILVDHNNLEGLPSNNVIGAIDHHIISGEIYDTLEIEYASTGLLIYDLFKDTYEFNEEEKKLIALTVLSDTEYLTSKRFTEEDKILYDSLNLNLDVNYYQKKYFKITDFSKDINDNIYSNYKEYNIDNLKISRTMLSSYNKEFNKYFSIYQEYANINNLLLIWCNYEDLKTYIVYNNNLITLDYILTSTNLIIKKLKLDGYLDNRKTIKI